MYEMKKNSVVFMCQLNGRNHANLSFETSTISIGCCVFLVTTSLAENPKGFQEVLGSIEKQARVQQKKPLLRSRIARRGLTVCGQKVCGNMTNFQWEKGDGTPLFTMWFTIGVYLSPHVVILDRGGDQRLPLCI